MRASTNFDPDPGQNIVTSLQKQVPNIDFYDDPVIQNIFTVEAAVEELKRVKAGGKDA